MRREIDLNDYEALKMIWKQRKEHVEARQKLGTTISTDNSRLITHIRNLLRPICQRVGIGLHLSIEEKKVVVASTVGYKFRKGGVSFTVSIHKESMSSWINSEDSVKKFLRNIELNLRIAKKIMKSEKVSFRKPENIVVSIDTRTKYF